MTLAPQRSLVPFFAAAFIWNVGLGMTYILVPLTAYQLGLSGVAIGALLSFPAILQTLFNLVGGVAADRLGPRMLVIGSTMITALAGLLYSAAAGFAMLFAAQLLAVAGRAMFWPATWALASQLPGNTSVQMGRLNSATNAGNITGTMIAGAIIASFGFGLGFAMYVGANLLALGGFLACHYPARTKAPTPFGFATYAKYARRPAMRFAILCAVVAAVPFTLSASFYPILLAERGFTSDTNGLLVALRGVGAVVAGIAIAPYVQRTASARIPVIATIAVGAAIGLSAWVGTPALVGISILAVGFAATAVTLYFQLLVAELSTSAERGQAMALGGMGWSLSHIGTPFLMGYLKDTLGISQAFYALGAVFILWGLMLIPLHRRAFRSGRPR